MLPLLATQILWINLITDSGPALAMGIDPETDDVMARPPRRPDRARDRRAHVVGRDRGSALVMALATLLTHRPLPAGRPDRGRRDDLANARTAGFTVLVLAQLFNCFNARSETTSAFRHLFVNRWLWGAIALSVLLQVAVVHLGLLNVAFGTVPLTPAAMGRLRGDGQHACCGSASCASWRCARGAPVLPTGTAGETGASSLDFHHPGTAPQCPCECRASPRNCACCMQVMRRFVLSGRCGRAPRVAWCLVGGGRPLPTPGSRIANGRPSRSVRRAPARC